MVELAADVFWESLMLFPFLLAAYLVLEYLEHKASGRLEEKLKASGSRGAVTGALLGLFPQCGFAAAAANFYAARLISLGTLVAVFLTTSDEMLPILISNAAAPKIILTIFSLKFVIGVAAGILTDWFLRKKKAVPVDIEVLCRNQDCRCEDGIIKSAFRHAVKITLFVAVVSLLFNLAISYRGSDYLSRVVFQKPFLGEAAAAAIGLIPNCSASVVITQLYLEGAMKMGTMLSGTLSGAGVGLLVLFRVNPNWRQNLKILALLYAISLFSGWVVNLFI